MQHLQIRMLQALSAARTALSRNGALHAAIADVLRLILLWSQSTFCYSRSITCCHTDTIMLFLYSPSSARTLCSLLMLRFLSQGADTKWDARWTGPRTWEMMDSAGQKSCCSTWIPKLQTAYTSPSPPYSKNFAILVRINYYHSFVWCFCVFFHQVVTLMKHGYTIDLIW